MIYLNNAATSFPKPDSVIIEVSRALAEPAQEPGRSGISQRNLLGECRHELAQLFSVPRPEQVVLTFGATYGLNLVIHGIISEHARGHVLTTELEHNSVLRPLEHLRRAGKIEVKHLAPGDNGLVGARDFSEAMRPDTRLVCVNHASNVTGNILPVEEIAQVAALNNVPLLIDASQSAGAVELCYHKLPGRVFVVIAGHKGLFGPTGTGAMIVPDDKLPQIFVGGTGIRSDLLVHPPELPLRHEAGTPNLHGIAGLSEGVRFVLNKGVTGLGEHRKTLVVHLREKLNEIGGIHLSPLAYNDGRAGVVSFNLDGWHPQQLGHILKDAFDIEVRDGLHCAPMAHRSLGTQKHGTIRASFSCFNTEDHANLLASAILTIGKP